MKKIFALCFMAFLLNSSFILPQQENKTIAILDFSNNSIVEKEKYSALSQALAEIMITELSKVPDLQLVERQRMNALLQEMQLSQSGVLSEQAGIQVGKLLGAHYLVFGSYMVSFDQMIRVDVRIVEVETGITIKAEEITDKVGQLFHIIKKLNEKIVKDLNIRLSKEARAAWQNSAVSFDVISSFSTALKLEEQNKFKEAKQIYQTILSNNPAFEPARKRLNELSTKNKDFE
ncbi:MAG: CsgG/HfaB family protein [candidate division KSB1 bacterium]|nr:CsgG/HfaB family protein [candidate division KSB1 bacterium]MDZ7335242.1 CsgG/HfaB family protein [candidate division KSB1 bacterium]MDZ7358278.1 CsgG/HfaB family protein [candidate division KSB1 bacterium]MDZ7401403.1 CsgG/HfaB family protein [candidate division KSB1 bacterium]